MKGESRALTLTFDEFEATAKRITHQWMRHMGYKQHAIDGAEQLVDDDSPIDIDDPAADAIRDLLDSSELVVFVMERLAGLPEVGVPVVARDDAAELRQIISDTAAALGTGAFIAPAASIAFMQELPGEVRLAMTRARDDAAELTALVREWAHRMDETLPPRWWEGPMASVTDLMAARSALRAALAATEGES